MKSELCFRGARVVIAVEGDRVCLKLDGGNGGPPVYLGADAASLVGAELERAALHIHRAKRKPGRVEGLQSYVENYHAKGNAQ